MGRLPHGKIPHAAAHHIGSKARRFQRSKHLPRSRIDPPRPLIGRETHKSILLEIRSNPVK